MNEKLKKSARNIAAMAVFIGFTSLAGCTAMNAQNPTGALKPSNVTTDSEGVALMLKGADVVAYFTDAKYMQGVPQFQSTYENVIFRFASADHKALFDKEPTKYMPQYNGFCANGVVYGIPWGGDADTFKMVEGKLYIFGGAGSRDGWNLDEPKNKALADKYWAEEIKDSNSFIQRSKRMVMRVPHYKSGEALAAEVAAAKAKS
jgi:YHS domain-containing protein